MDNYLKLFILVWLIDTYIGNVNGVMNAVITEGKPVGESIFQGEGAGPGPTSSSLLSDLLSILRGNIKYPFIVSKSRKNIKILIIIIIKIHYILDLKLKINKVFSL